MRPETTRGLLALVLWVSFFTMTHCFRVDDLKEKLRRMEGNFTTRSFGRPTTVSSRVTTAETDAQTCAKNLDQLTEVSRQLARQVIQQQLFVEERIRSDGASGLKQCRLVRQGSKHYHATSYVDGRLAAMHNHPNNIRIAGLGEFIAVLNGVEFRTRHNDYKIVMPSKTSKAFKAVQDIPYPQVPWQVKNKPTLELQIKEMREWFRAWHDQDWKFRDYRKYFKAVLCYLEGSWTLSDGATIDESFASERHHIDASSWLDLQDKIRFTSYTGKKDANENYAYLPTTILNVSDSGNFGLKMAQWNYRILCHPLSRDLPTNRLRLIDDLQTRIAYGRTMEAHGKSRAARYRVGVRDNDKWKEGLWNYGLLDQLMAEIPGMDNYGANLKDFSKDIPIKDYSGKTPLNTGFYSRWFTASKDAMGASRQHRGFADENLFVAMTTQPKVPEMAMDTNCKKIKGQKKPVCDKIKQRVSYAIPLEIIYLTPLYNWNPHDIAYTSDRKDKTVTAGGRNGQSKNKALKGTSLRMFYRTPETFFGSDDEENKDLADTATGAVWVENKKKQQVKVVASGLRIHLPNIPGLGTLRTRYPIFMTHQEGSAIWKELEALKDMVLHPKSFKHMFDDSDAVVDSSVKKFKMSPSSAAYGSHVHYFEISTDDKKKLEDGKDLRGVGTSEASGHTHTLRLRMVNGKIVYKSCTDSATKEDLCKDGHGRNINEAN